jgi:hypothetical protein
MTYRDRKLRSTENNSASKLPIPVGLSGSTLKLTVLEDEIGMATVVRVAGM